MSVSDSMTQNFITNHFSGLDRAVGAVCVSLSVSPDGNFHTK